MHSFLHPFSIASQGRRRRAFGDQAHLVRAARFLDLVDQCRITDRVTDAQTGETKRL